MVFRTFQQLTVASSLRALQEAGYALKIPDIRSLTPAEGFQWQMEQENSIRSGTAVVISAIAELHLAPTHRQTLGQSSQHAVLPAPSGGRVYISIIQLEITSDISVYLLLWVSVIDRS